MSSFRKPHDVRRRFPGQRVDGRWQEGETESVLSIQASIQPASAGDYERLQVDFGGRRIGSTIRVYTDAVLNVAGADLRNGDLVLWPPGAQSQEYLVVAVSPWQSGVIPHYRYLAVKGGGDDVAD